MKPIIAVPAIAALVFRAWSKKSLTPAGIVAALLTAIAHAVHPWNAPFALLCVFFLAGTGVTKVNHDVKARLTHSSSGSPGGEGPRTHIQVLANSAVASVLILLHAWQLSREPDPVTAAQCWPRGSDVLIVGIVANYAAVAADTFSSELGILSRTPPRLITAPWRTVPRGTNGGVSDIGFATGLMGSLLLAGTATLLLPFCSPAWDPKARFGFTMLMTFAGLCGTVIDSLLGAVLQASVVDTRTGKVVEGDGGRKVKVHSAGSAHLKQRAVVREALTGDAKEGDDPVAQSSGVAAPRTEADGARHRAAEKAGSVLPGPDDGESRRVVVGWDVLSNNGVNIVMAALVSGGSMAAAAWTWGLQPADVLAGLL
ncbi:uncharacterized protein K452DRAFT_283977 [Aplosporella prunicola CBS 121167]|uniref:DUF92 domain-containing protein n=1 Tax=Aplosporella prunicola CBS 121167 TaxID=1176127 RepID=A0A6A6BQW3_9PEZI|nr:uncharacterized protein K452DRAFT_283977 [Aplosporella prunicola CBS 121167]KAF2145624.1 hypothetical protein K452DRAFT_283977 [Aplosporella prunicola CBS 121167]